MESRIFFDYKIARTKHANKKYVNLDYGINLNIDAIKFFKKYNTLISKSAILEWAKFLEKLNIGLPKLILKTE